LLCTVAAGVLGINLAPLSTSHNTTSLSEFPVAHVSVDNPASGPMLGLKECARRMGPVWRPAPLSYAKATGILAEDGEEALVHAASRARPWIELKACVG